MQKGFVKPLFDKSVGFVNIILDLYILNIYKLLLELLTYNNYCGILISLYISQLYLLI
jgi:hypothetical protein